MQNLTKGLLILASLVGYEMAVKVWALLKMTGFKPDKMEKKDFEEILEDPKFRKYKR